MKYMSTLLTLMLVLPVLTEAQPRWFTKTGRIRFDATVPKSPEEIVGVNNSVVCVLDTKTGALQFSVLMKGFQFKAALMEEHFNENYVESNKFPKSEFRGTIINNTSVDYSKEGTYPVKVKGRLSIHGETKDVESDGQIQIANGKVVAKSSFSVLLKDYQIEVPRLVADKLSATAKISVECSLEPLK